MRIRPSSVHTGERILKVADSQAGFAGGAWTEGNSRRKSCGFKNIRISVDG